MGVKYNIHDPNDDKYYYCCSNDCPCNDDHDIFTNPAIGHTSYGRRYFDTLVNIPNTKDTE
jgi:hypothetical protein